MSSKLKKKKNTRSKCRKCGGRLVLKPGYGIVCPSCGWIWKQYEEVIIEGIDDAEKARKLKKAMNDAIAEMIQEDC